MCLLFSELRVSATAPSFVIDAKYKLACTFLLRGTYALHVKCRSINKNVNTSRYAQNSIINRDVRIPSKLLLPLLRLQISFEQTWLVSCQTF
jgi:hypothetical protein